MKTPKTMGYQRRDEKGIIGVGRASAQLREISHSGFTETGKNGGPQRRGSWYEPELDERLY